MRRALLLALSVGVGLAATITCPANQYADIVYNDGSPDEICFPCPSNSTSPSGSDGIVSCLCVSGFMPGPPPCIRPVCSKSNDAVDGTNRDCSNHGWCRVDAQCSCHPDWFGDKCEYYIETGGVTDGGLAGIIIGWILALPILMCAGYWAYDKYQNEIDEFDCTCSCAGLMRLCSSCTECCSRSRPAPAAQRGDLANNNNNNNVDHAPRSIAVEMHIPSQPQGNAQGQAGNDGAASGQASGPVRRQSAQGVPAPAGARPADAEQLITQILDIMQHSVSRHRAEQALRDSSWNMESALAALLTA